MGVSWYGAVQVILGFMIAIPSLTQPYGVPSMTVGLYIGLILTGLYAVTGSSYIKSAKSSLTALEAESRETYERRLFSIYRHFLIIYSATCIILCGLGIGSFIEGTILYFDPNNTISDSGSTPAISGIAAFLICSFISGCIIGEARKLRAPDFTRPRSPTPSSQFTSVSTLYRPESYPPPYSACQDETDPKWEEMPPSYIEAIQTISSNIQSTDQVVAPQDLQTREASNAVVPPVLSAE